MYILKIEVIKIAVFRSSAAVFKRGYSNSSGSRRPRAQSFHSGTRTVVLKRPSEVYLTGSFNDWQVWSMVTKAECIYQDQIDDQMLQRPDGRPDGSWVTRLLTKLAMSCCLLGKYQGLLNKSELKQASLDNQIAPGDQIGRPDFHILVMSKIWSPIWLPGAIWSPIRSP